MKVLVKERIGESGVQLLRDAGLEVEVGTDWADGELENRIGEFDGLLIRSGTQLTADLLQRAERLKAVGRAGVGVDNVDVDAATKRGVVVANAPQSNVITAAEHTLAMLLALARKVPFRKAVASYAAEHHIPVVRFGKDDVGGKLGLTASSGILYYLETTTWGLGYGIGLGFGDYVDRVERVVGRIEHIVLIGIVASTLIVVAYRVLHKHLR